MIQKIRNSYITKGLSVWMLMTLIVEIVQPTTAMALGGGPSQPEMQGFTPISMSENVDLSSGAFNYNIPLLDVGGYPINISYSSGVTMDQEASWVGLGWSLNPGVLNRSMRGIPDDFQGDEIHKEFHMKPNISTGVSGSVAALDELVGFESDIFTLSAGMGLNYNNYTGFGFSFTVAPSFDFALATENTNLSEFGVGVSLTASDNGLNISPSLSLSGKEDKMRNGDLTSVTSSVGVGLSYNSRTGFKDVSISLSAQTVTKTTTDKIKDIADEKKERGTGGSNYTRGYGGAGSVLSIGNPTYTPMVQFPKINAGISFAGKLGTAFFTTDGASATIRGYFSTQTLAHTEEDVPAYGYMNSQTGQDLQEVIHDFNREKDVSYTKGTPNLAVTNYTYDIYTAVGQGVGGMFRPFRSDIGHVYDKEVSNVGIDGSLGIEINVGNLADAGGDIDVNISTQKTSKWDGPTNKAAMLFRFINGVPGSLYEPVYFKQVGELAVDEDPLFQNMQGFDPVAIKLKYTWAYNVEAMQTLYSNTDSDIPVNFVPRRSVGREKRNMLFSHLTIAEAEAVGLPTGTSIYTGAEDHHIGEVSVTRPDGVRYIYGIPAYNVTQEDATFSVGAFTDISGTGLVGYTADVDNSVDNNQGNDHYYESTTLPPYAHSYLLTAVISPDYVDRTNNGPSLDDYGTYTKFSYTKVHDNYKWRVPYEENQANFNEGIKTLNGDNKGSYIFGAKEIWYLDKIETKTHVAIFETSDRADGLGVEDHNGGPASTAQKLKQLDKITLYTKPDYDANSTNAIPVKAVHFVYDNHLCPGLPNSTGNVGKLTLREIYFSYGNSDKAKLSPYRFLYGDLDGNGVEDPTGSNASYDLKDYNLWGTYKPNGTTPNNAEFPYVVQNKTNEDKYVAQWHLTNIILPSGAEMKIQYESNDYAYVQNKEIMEFFRVVGSAQTKNGVVSADELADYQTNGKNTFWGNDNTPGEVDHLFTIVELPTWAQTYSSANFVDNVIRPLNGSPIRFNYFVNLSKDGYGYSPDKKEFVTGYAEIDDSADFYNAGVHEIDNVLYGYFKFNAVPEENKVAATANTHPVAKTAWQWARLYNPNMAYNQNGVAVDMNTDQTSIVEALAGSINSFAEIFNGPNGFIRNKGIAKEFDPAMSWVRLPSAADYKLGGGARVKQISVSDKWAEMTNNAAEGDYYGQTYSYKNIEGKSSGVATFEPLMSKENPLITPLSYSEERFGVPDEKYILEKPYGLSFFPTPRVTYGRVEVRSLNKVYNRSGDYTSTNRTGKTVTEFYTTKDYPTIVRQTRMDKKPYTPDPVLKLLKLNVREQATVSQGYVIELNDMDGKLKSQMIFAENKETPVSGVRYIYGASTSTSDYADVDPDTAPNDPFEATEWEETRLDNNVLTIGADGVVEENQIGVEFDIITDFRENKSEHISAGVDANVGSFIMAVFPVVVPTLFPTFSRQNTRFRSAVTTKVINRYGIIREVQAFDNGTQVSTQNLAWDRETGDVLLTKTKNEFGDAYYSMNFPAHWTYDRMGQAYKNINFMIFNLDAGTGGTGYYTEDGITNLVKGDEVMITYMDGVLVTQRAWVLKVESSPDQVYLIDENGQPINETIFSLKVIRSGRRNQQSTSVGSLTMKSDPTRDNLGALKNLDDASFDDTYSTTEIIAASATEFSEEWGLVCGGYTDGYYLTQECSLTTAADDILGGSVLAPKMVLCNYYVFLADGYNPANLNDLILNGNYVFTGSLYSSYNTFSTEFTSVVVGADLQSNYDQQHLFFTGDYLTYDDEEFVLVTGCFPLWECAEPEINPEAVACGIHPGDVINPFVENVQGVWRPLRGWARLGARHQMDFDLTANADQVTNVRTQGKYSDFAYFWKKSGSTWVATPTDWTWVTTITPYRGYDQDGMERENMDALYRFSAAVNGYANTLPIAVAANATYRQIAFDGFEDYDYYLNESCKKRHFAFENATLSEWESHTGRYSLQLNGMNSIGLARILNNVEPEVSAQTTPYEVRDCECQGTFGPETYDLQAYLKSAGATFIGLNKTYILSYWVKRADQNNLVSTYSGIAPTISIDGTPLSLTGERKSAIIDGWQKVEYLFTIPGDNDEILSIISVAFDNTEATTVYLDDIRIQPYNSAMKTYVYDAITLRLMAQLDDNNFATFYEYDEEGKLIRIKKETARGIMTIQESRSGILKEEL